MADTYIQSCFAFTCTSAEMALLEEAFQASYDLEADCMSDDVAPSEMFARLFPPVAEDRWAGFRALFLDPDLPALGAVLEGVNAAGESACSVVITGEVDFQPMAVARLIQRCCARTLAEAPIGFEWSATTSRMRIDGFGGGWCAIFPDRIDCQTTGRALSAALESGQDCSSPK